jgi:hypothetical protein
MWTATWSSEALPTSSVHEAPSSLAPSTSTGEMDGAVVGHPHIADQQVDHPSFPSGLAIRQQIS